MRRRRRRRRRIGIGLLLLAGAVLAAVPSLGATPFGPGTPTYRADMDRAVRKYRGAEGVPAAAVRYLSRLHGVDEARVRADLEAAECHEIRRQEVPRHEIAPVFEGICSNCHSPTGVGDGEMAEIFDVPAERMNLVSGRSRRWPVEAVVAVIESGRGEMPAYRKALEEEQMVSLVRFLRTIEDACGAGERTTR